MTTYGYSRTMTPKEEAQWAADLLRGYRVCSADGCDREAKHNWPPNTTGYEPINPYCWTHYRQQKGARLLALEAKP